MTGIFPRRRGSTDIAPVRHRKMGLLSPGDCPRFLARLFAVIESRPEGAEPNGAEINALMYPGRRFALPWAISFCPFGAVGVRWLIVRPQGFFATTGRGMIIHRPRSSGLLPQRGAR